jgi:hypothetical protein
MDGLPLRPSTVVSLYAELGGSEKSSLQTHQWLTFVINPGACIQACNNITKSFATWLQRNMPAE